VTVVVDDVAAVVRRSVDRFDVMLLDVDNGPAAFTEAANAGLYGDSGLASARAALKKDGILAVWSAWDDRKFEQRLRYNGFRAETTRVRARLHKGGPRHTIFLGYRDP
jgi:spermidine synthase